MLLSQIQCVLLLTLLNLICTEGRLLWKIKKRFQRLQMQRAKNLVYSDLLTHVTEGKIQQKLNHFNKQEAKIFPQRFLVNEKYWQRPSGPVFLFIGGEGPISVFDVVAGHHVDIARAHGALLLALEHRFYGDSIAPDNGLETQTLVHLSSQQALVDLAVFHQFISHRFNLTKNNTWISFGGSYSGALSAWFRGKFPHLVYGAVASSAPVKAKLDFSEYNQIVGLSLTNEDVGGSVKCLGEVQKAFTVLEAELMSGNSSHVTEDFGCCQDPKNMDDKIELVQSLADIFMGTVQYNEEGVLMSIREACELMTNTSESSYKRLVKIAQVYRSSSDQPCLDVSREAEVQDLMDTSLHSARGGERQWMYQTCSEFGFYQTCEDSRCPFSGMVMLDTYTRLCSLVFGISQNSLKGHIAFTNMYYGADNPQTSRVLYVNSGVDPWQALSVIRARTEDEEKPIFIKDTAHCADMMNPKATDPSSLREAREEIQSRVSSWLKMAALNTT